MKPLFVVGLLVVSSSAVADTKGDIATEEARIDALQKELAPLVAPLEQTKSDIRVFVSFAPITSAVADLNNLAAASRTLSFQSTGANGHFYDNNGLCNSYVELQSPGDLTASGALTGFSATAQPDGSLIFGASADTNGHLQAHWQFLGVRVPGPFGIGNVCPPGGGVGGSIGATFQKGLTFHVQIAFALSGDGQSLSYRASVVDPNKVDVTISLGLQHIGNIGIPISFNVPSGPIATGQFAMLIANGGKFVIPGEKAPREYKVKLIPAGFTANQTGITSEWTSAIDFQTPVEIVASLPMQHSN